MNVLDQIAGKIISEQALIIGPLAWREARKVEGLRILNESSGEIELQNSNPKEVIDRLVNQYERLFGQASHEVCREAVATLVRRLAPADIPSSLSA